MGAVPVAERGCLSCTNFQICKLFRDIRDPLHSCEGVFLNLHKDGRTPGVFTGIFESIGRSCFKYQPILIEGVNNEKG
jgi:hypothetical protein